MMPKVQQYEYGIKFAVAAVAATLWSTIICCAAEPTCIVPGAGQNNCSFIQDSITIKRTSRIGAQIIIEPKLWPLGNQFEIEIGPTNTSILDTSGYCTAKTIGDNAGNFTNAMVQLSSDCDSDMICSLHIRIPDRLQAEAEFGCFVAVPECDMIYEYTIAAVTKNEAGKANIKPTMLLILISVASLLGGFLVITFVYLFYLHHSETEKLQQMQVNSAPMSLETDADCPDEGFIAVNFKI